ncbi:hypothetical protein, partial [Photorhabdus sp. RM323S]|uniref:hypothetical protein n=1 Tax=Photorhabdus sp. RM323S TaxID=3342828 RepID=UPI0036DB591C
MKRSLLGFIIIMGALCAPSAFSAVQCSGYHLSVGENGGLTYVNGEKVTSQKIAFLKQKDDYANIKMDMGLMPARDGNMYGFQFIKRNGKA